MNDQATVSHPFHWVARRRPAGRVFCFIRHPASWLRSYWSMRRAEGIRDPNKLLDRLWSSDPNEWIQRICQEHPGFVGQLFDAYISHVDEVHRLEDGINQVLSDILGRPVISARKNRGRPVELSRETLRMVSVSEHAVIEKYYQ